MARLLPVPVRRTLVLIAALAGLVLSSAASCSGTNAPGSPGTSCMTSTRNSNGGTTRTVYQKCVSYGSRTTTTRTTSTNKNNSSGKDKHSDDDDD
jgi:hypothetical protein